MLQDTLSHNHSYQTEFHHSVWEVFNDIKKADIDQSIDEIEQNFLRLIEPDNTIRFKVEWFDDNNRVNVNRGYRIQFNNLLGAYKGGLRFHPTVDESVLKFLGFEQIFKNALTDLPMGGAKGGSDFNPKGKSINEIRSFCQAFARKLIPYIGPYRDVPAGDIGVSSRELGYIFGQYILMKQRHEGAITGKDPLWGGSNGRAEATGYGCVYFLNEATKHHNIELENMEILVSGSGNVALYAVEKLIELNSKPLTVSDSNGTLFFEDGISKNNLEKLKKLKLQERKRLSDFTSDNSKYIDGKSPWFLKADIAMPCATQNEITIQDANSLVDNGIIAVCEGANMPCDHEAVQFFEDQKVLFLPGKAANAGGVSVSHFERTQNATLATISPKMVDEKLQETMKKIHQNTIAHVDKINGITPYKMGANIYSYLKVSKTLKHLYGN